MDPYELSKSLMPTPAWQEQLRAQEEQKLVAWLTHEPTQKKIAEKAADAELQRIMQRVRNGNEAR